MKNTTDMKEADKKEEAKSAQNNASPEQDKLDAVRDLLFGQEVKEHQQEIQEVKALISRNKSESDESDEALKVEILQKLDQLSKQFEEKSSQIEKKLDALSDSKVDRTSLAGLLKDIANKLES